MSDALLFSDDYSEMKNPSLFIQWKGTDLCADFYCICGVASHICGFFAYRIRCASCRRVFETPHTISLREVVDHGLPTVEDTEFSPDAQSVNQTPGKETS